GECTELAKGDLEDIGAVRICGAVRDDSEITFPNARNVVVIRAAGIFDPPINRSALQLPASGIELRGVRTVEQALQTESYRGSAVCVALLMTDLGVTKS